MKPVWGLCLIAASLPASALETEGLVDLRLVRGDAERSWEQRALGKLRVDAEGDGLRLHQALIVGRQGLFDTVGATFVAHGYDDREGFADLSEAFLQWKPVPSGPWRNRVKLGAFFPAFSLENSGPGWSAPGMLSTSAINAWLGEEVRTLGAEWTLSRPGRFAGSDQDWDFVLGVFGWNDPAGALLAWRGWSVGERVTGLNERLDLARLPVWRPGGALPRQKPWVEPFTEIDDRLGYYTGLRYAWTDALKLSALHYDNRGEPTVIHDGQYAWATRYDQVAALWKPAEAWEVSAQALRGDTRMGRSIYRGVYAEYQAAYLLLARDDGQNRVSLRADRYSVDDEDMTPMDDNGEDGRAWALAWLRRWNESLDLGAEYLVVDSERPARAYLGRDAEAREQSLSLSLRWRF
ncbi:MAG: hypothetical protein HYV16_06335 [Gammaproteobacteria bacterium]|nr:hypothetical protein [Gammaproteobacteria bacterium]